MAILLGQENLVACALLFMPHPMTGATDMQRVQRRMVLVVYFSFFYIIKLFRFVVAITDLRVDVEAIFHP